MKQVLCTLVFTLLIAVPAAFSADGKIWHVAGQRFISERVLLQHLASRDTILLGARLDNPKHNKLAAQILKALVRADRNPIVLMSNVERSKQNAFAIFRQRQQAPTRDYDASGLDMLLDWSGSGQPDWAVVRPVFDMSMLRKLPLYAINFSRYEVGQLHHDGLGGLPADLKQQLMPILSPPLPEKIAARLAEEIQKTFCANLPPGAVEKLSLIQRARSGLFALAITRHSADWGHGTTVLIAPEKHIRKDAGIPQYLDRMGTKQSIARLSFVEAGPDELSLPKRNTKADFIWFTASKSRPDPCGLLTP